MNINLTENDFEVIKYNKINKLLITYLQLVYLLTYRLSFILKS